MRKPPALVVICLVALLAACQTSDPGHLTGEIAGYSYTVPIQDEGDWETARPEPRHLSVARLEDGVRAIMRGEYPNIHSILVASHGMLVFEEYFPGYAFHGGWTDFDCATSHTLQSATKSLAALVVGISVDQGHIHDIDSSVLTWYPEYDRPDRAQKETITVRDLLTMRSGLEWNEWSVSPFSRFNDLNRFYRNRRPIEFLLRKDLVDEPGTAFSYNTGSTNLLGDLVYQSTGQKFDEYADQYFFRPLGIDNVQWESGHPDMIVTGAGLKLRPRDFLRIGQLVLRNGIWGGTQVIPEAWLTQALYPSVSLDVAPDIGFRTDYGFLWWLPSVMHPESQTVLRPYGAAGWGGQYLIVYPEQEIVVVMTGGNYETEDASAQWHNDYFLPAIVVGSQ
jgi:CubicO group peptidase (beta-lactamase class C family)